MANQIQFSSEQLARETATSFGLEVAFRPVEADQLSLPCLGILKPSLQCLALHDSEVKMEATW